MKALKKEVSRLQEERGLAEDGRELAREQVQRLREEVETERRSMGVQLDTQRKKYEGLREENLRIDQERSWMQKEVAQLQT